MTTIGLIGAGHIGRALARTAVAAGYAVVVSNSRGPHTLVDLVAGGAATRVLLAGLVVAAVVTVVGHLVAVLSSSRLR